MFTLLLLLISLAAAVISAYAAAARPLDEPPVEAAIPLAGLGLQWRRLRDVQTRNGPRTLWAGDGDPTTYSRAYGLARDALRTVGYSWGTAERQGGAVQPLCWEDPALPAGRLDQALADAAAALAIDDERIRAAEARRRQAAELEATLSGEARRADVEALRRSLKDLGWAWSRRKREVAESLLREPEELPGVPRAHVAKLARVLAGEVDYAIAEARRRAASDPLHAWLDRAQDEEVRRVALTGLQHVTELDADYASVRNSQGWGRSHTHLGHVLAEEKSLSVIQASQALGALHRHRTQLPAALRRELFGDE